MNEKYKLPHSDQAVDYQQLTEAIKKQGQVLGFQQVGITALNLAEASRDFQTWLDKQFHGEMSYMARNVDMRANPELLVPHTIRAISVRMDYKVSSEDPDKVLDSPELAYVSRYALGRDYHKLMRKRLQKLATFIEQHTPHQYRVFVDSAPVLEKSLASSAGLGWVGKHSNLLNKEDGSWFFLGEIYTSLPLPTDTPVGEHCGECRACIDVCPTQAIVAPYEVDARRCISYLTIELKGSIPVEFRPLMGNRIYGCDDCQLVCPWNRFAKLSQENDYLPRHQLDAPSLLALFSWSEDQFNERLQGSPIRRIGHESWLRNIAIALGNGPKTPAVISALQERLNHPSEIVREHVQWALTQAPTMN